MVELTWKGKEEVKNFICKPSTKEFDINQNHLFCGDNIDVLQDLQHSYQNRIKMIYIDPPYNTGNKFVYHDSLGTEVWLNMMYPRLVLAKNLLKEDGAIFISIDDNEQSSLKSICDEIFGRKNFVNTIIWERKYAPINNAKHFSTNHDFILCYAKNKSAFSMNLLPRTEKQNKAYRNLDNDPRGIWRTDNLSVSAICKNNIYPITNPAGKECWPPKGRCWGISKDKLQDLIKDNRIYFASKGAGTPRLKRFLVDVQDGTTPTTIWKYDEVGHTIGAATALKTIFNGEKFFDYPKPVDLIKRIVHLTTKDDDIILDFFAGSGTTAQAVYELNLEDKANRKWLMIQLDEVIKEDTDAYKHGYRTIFDICKERIIRTTKDDFIIHR